MTETGKSRKDHAQMVVQRIHGAAQEIGWDHPDTQQGILSAVENLPLHELSAFSIYVDRLQDVLTGELSARSAVASQQRYVMGR